jgi:chaperonin GroES
MTATKTKFPLEALYNNVIVRRDETESISAGGIILPPKNGEQPLQGTVVAIGEGRMLPDGSMHPMSIAVGDIVFFSNMGLGELQWEGDTYSCMNDTQVFAKYRPE